MKAPQLYLDGHSGFSNSMSPVPTAVPVFIGHTEKADNDGKSLLKKPFKIASMAEYLHYFGKGQMPVFSITKDVPPVQCTNKDFPVGQYSVAWLNNKYNLYFSMLLFYKNGGGACYIVSIGNYTTDYDIANFIGGIDSLTQEKEPTIVILPELVNLKFEECLSVQRHALMHCGKIMQNRIVLLDVYDGYKNRQDPTGDVIFAFREAIGCSYLDYAAAYYPWLNTEIIDENSLSFLNIDASSRNVLTEILTKELVIPIDAQLVGIDVDKDKEAIDRLTEQKTLYTALFSSIKDDYGLNDIQVGNINHLISQMSPFFRSLLNELKKQINLLPPSAALAGLYNKIDNSRGVWKAPDNVCLNSIVSPTVKISDDNQEDLMASLDGKSINAIRSFIGAGVLVWSARTLDGNSIDWRYINVRRTMIMLEQSIKIATKAYSCEPNVANTWIMVKNMIGPFLTGIWMQGGLAGASPDEAFSVYVGLGETMTPEDILEGFMRVTVLVAIIRPAEFMEITFQQEMQKS
jgi:uncharacterized protein